MGRGWKKYIEVDVRNFESNGFYPLLTIMLALFGLYLFFSKDPLIYSIIKTSRYLICKEFIAYDRSCFVFHCILYVLFVFCDL